MTIITSISPGHINSEAQQAAVESWQGKGMCFSINKAEEIEKLKEDYKKINFVPTDRTLEYFVGKPVVCISAMISWAKIMNDDLLLINSDIIFKELPAFRDDGVTMFSRYDLDSGAKFEPGFDVFYIPKKFLSIFPPTLYAMGVAFWDYWLPKHCILNNIPLYYPAGKFAFHKHHLTQYSQTEWDYIGEFFKWEFRYDKKLTVPQVTTQALNEIKSKLIT